MARISEKELDAIFSRLAELDRRIAWLELKLAERESVEAGEID